MSTLELHQVVKHYRSGDGEVVRAVDGVSLTISPGELMALYGPSGSGKTTLMLMVAAVLRPEAGTIRFGEHDIGKLSERESARYRLHEVGFVSQAFHLQRGATALDNATIKLTADGQTLRAARRHAYPWLERVGLSERAHHTPDELSIGERQRVAIARALAGEPNLLLADEPTGSLDSKRSRQVLELIRSICHEREIPALLVTHDPQAQAFADRVHTLRDGMLSDGVDSELSPVLC
ncbi:MAG: ABC transporter ATP-binding protein [Solirubrobacteraceae bacterium]